MITSKFIVFCTAWRHGSGKYSAQLMRMSGLSESLHNHGYLPTVSAGRWVGHYEPNFAVPVFNMGIAKQIARHVGAVYQQECISVLDTESMLLSLVYPNGAVEEVGIMQQMTPEQAARAVASTYWQGAWWVADV